MENEANSKTTTTPENNWSYMVLNGIVGPQGEQGIQGEPGTNGTNGEPGAKGEPGTNGTNGEPGAKGEPGTNGTNGEPGAKGEPGTNGTNGEPGAKGEPGTNGTNGEPGAKGEPGTNGTNGEPGAKGEPGTNGTNGEPGAKGEPGANGTNGTNGTNGEPGPQGPPGPAGNVPAGTVIMYKKSRIPDGFGHTGYSVLPSNAKASFGTLNDMPQRRTQHAVVAISGEIFCIGGSPGGGAVDHLSNKMQRFETDIKRWTTVTDMPVPRVDCIACAHNGQIYIFGGYENEGKTASKKVFRYSINGIWETLPDMPQAVRGGACASVNGKIYVIGGTGIMNLRATLQVFEPHGSTWSEPKESGAPNFTYARAVAVDNKIYLIGGKLFVGGTKYRCISGVFNPQDESFRDTSGDYAGTGYSPAVVLLRDKIIVLGGVDDNNNPLNGSAWYDHHQNAWLAYPVTLSKKVCNAAGAAAGDNLYVFGGSESLEGPAVPTSQTGADHVFYMIEKRG